MDAPHLATPTVYRCGHLCCVVCFGEAKDNNLITFKVFFVHSSQVRACLSFGKHLDKKLAKNHFRSFHYSSLNVVWVLTTRKFITQQQMDNIWTRKHHPLLNIYCAQVLLPGHLGYWPSQNSSKGKLKTSQLEMRAGSIWDMVCWFLPSSYSS